MKNEFPESDINKIIQMCIFHDLGACFTGDIPAFAKTKEHEDTEESLLSDWVKSLPESTRNEMINLYKEMEERQTLEAKIYKATRIPVERRKSIIALSRKLLQLSLRTSTFSSGMVSFTITAVFTL